MKNSLIWALNSFILMLITLFLQLILNIFSITHLTVYLALVCLAFSYLFHIREGKVN